MKKIAFVSDGVYPFNKGGKEMRLYELCRRLVKRGYEVDVYTMKWWDTKDEIYKLDGFTYRAICKKYDLYDGERRSIKQGVMFGLACFNLLKYDFDVVDVDHMPFFPLYSMRIVCWLKHKRLIATWHEVWGKEYWVKYLGWKGVIAWWIEYVSMWLPDIVISVSEMTTKGYRQINGRTQVVTIENGVNWERIQKIPLNRRLVSDVVYAGRLLKHKHVDVLIGAIAVLKKNQPGVVCRVIGEGPEKKRLGLLVRRLGLEKQVLFHDFVEEHDELVSILKASRVFVLPSTREGFGLTVIEANACGLGVVTIDSDKNAARTLITPRTGRMVSLTGEEIAAGIVDVETKIRPRDCRRLAKTYGIDMSVDRYEHIIT